MANRAIVDASVVMAALLPGEPTRPSARRVLEQFAEGTLELFAPTLLPYEVANSLLKAERKPERAVNREITDALLEELGLLGIPMLSVSMASLPLGTMTVGPMTPAAWLLPRERESH